MGMPLDRFFKCAFIFLPLMILLPTSSLYGQAPDSINYQAVARNDQGDVLPNTNLSVRISVFSGGGGGTLVYEEEHSGVTTNQFGLFNLYIGGGGQTGGSASSFDAIAWGNDEHHIEVEVDAGSGYESLGSRKFVSVPYALYADSSGSGGGGAGTLQSAYEGGNTITLDTSNTPVRIESGLKPHLNVDSSAVRMGHANALDNTQLDVRYDAAPTPGPAIMGSSSPVVLPNSAFSGQGFRNRGRY